jgi:PAS domain S-box-containing protein
MVAYSMVRYGLMKLTTAETADIVIDTMADSLLVIDENKIIVNANKSALDLLGYTKEELINGPLECIVNLPHFESNVLSKVSADGRMEDVETEFFTKERKSIPMNISVSSIYNDKGELDGIIIVARDLTETKIFIHQLEEAKTKLEGRVQGRTAELEKSKRRIELQNIKLKKLDGLKSNFLNITSHELRTPVTSIKGYIQMLLKQILGDITEEQRRVLEVALRNTNRLNGLIQDILDISRLESGTMKFFPEKTGIGEMVTESVETMRPAADLKNIRINVDVDGRIPELVVDQERIKQVLINLISNAIKFSPDGSVINIKARREKDDILFEVQDFGRGIPKNKQKRIFETFYQVDSGMDRKFDGVGLGLSVSRGIILAHAGEIWVRSTLNKGSTFVFTLPIEPVQDIEGRFKEADIFGV